MEINWTSHDSSWFLNWFGLSADLTVLRAFFSITGPTVCAMYENLCSTVENLRRPAAAIVLFEILDTIRGNNPIVTDALNFLEIAVRNGSTSDRMLDIAGRAIERQSQVLDDAALHENLWLSLLVAASRRDTLMLRLLVDAGARHNSEAEFDVISPYPYNEWSLAVKTGYQLMFWSADEEPIIHDFVQLLIEGGILLTELPPRCYNIDRPLVELFSRTIMFDEAIMLCPARNRQILYDAIMSCSGESQTLVRHAGVFTAAARGTRSLEAYIQSCRQDHDFDTIATMQESLMFATLLNDTDTMCALLQIGTDPGAGLLQSNEDQYAKGFLPWNPMVIAAMAGSKEALMLLKTWSSPDNFLNFLEWAPVYEIVRQINLEINEQSRRACGTELERLDGIRQRLLYDDTANSESKFEIEIKVEGSRTNRLELLAWIRSNAMAHSLATNFDKKVLSAALLPAPRFHESMRYLLGTENHYCDVLLLEGLVDANLEYHESGMDLLQLSIRNRCSLEVVEFLLTKGFKVHSHPATQTETQLKMSHDALLSSSPDRCQIVNLLLHHGADCKQTGTALNLLEASLLLPRYIEPTQDYLDIFQRLLNEGAPFPQQPTTDRASHQRRSR